MGKRSLAVFAVAMACCVLFPCPVSIADDAAPPPEIQPAPMAPDTKAAKALLSQLADIYQKATDLEYKSTLVVNGPPDDSGKPGETVTLAVTGAAEKPNKFSVKAFDKKKLEELYYSDGNDTFQYDPLVGYYEKLPQPDSGLDLPALHTAGLMNAVDYATAFAARMFFEDNPYDLSYASTDSDTDVQFSLSDQKVGNQTVTQITEVYTNDKGVTTTLRVALDKTTNLPRKVSQDITTGGQTRTLFTEDFGDIHVGATPDDVGTYMWQPPTGTVMNWTPPKSDDKGTANSSTATGGNGN